MTVVNDQIISQLNIFEPFSSKQSFSAEGQKVLSYGLSSFGYDLRLSDKEFYIFCDDDSDSQSIIDPKRFDLNTGEFRQCHHTKVGSYFVLPPMTYALGFSLEYITMPFNFIGICLGKSTYARCGLIINCTPLEPGWKGHLTIEMFNATNRPMKIYANEGILQVILYQGLVPDNPYTGKYQSQENQITFAL